MSGYHGTPSYELGQGVWGINDLEGGWGVTEFGKIKQLDHIK